MSQQYTIDGYPIEPPCPRCGESHNTGGVDKLSGVANYLCFSCKTEWLMGDDGNIEIVNDDAFFEAYGNKDISDDLGDFQNGN